MPQLFPWKWTREGWGRDSRQNHMFDRDFFLRSGKSRMSPCVSPRLRCFRPHCIKPAFSSCVFPFNQQLSVITYLQSLSNVTVHQQYPAVMMMSLWIYHIYVLFWQDNYVKKLHSFINYKLTYLIPLLTNFDTDSFITCIFWNHICSQRWRLVCMSLENYTTDC